MQVERACHRYATIIEPLEGADVVSSGRGDDHRDDDDEHTTAVCGRRSRRQHVYTSVAHVVHIRLESYRVNPDYFVLSYQGQSAQLT